METPTLEIRMYRLWIVALPSALILTATLVQDRLYAQNTSVSIPNAANQTAPSPADAEANLESEEEGQDEMDDADLSMTMRKSKKQALELFADYNTFVSEKQYFQPVTVGFKHQTHRQRGPDRRSFTNVLERHAPRVVQPIRFVRLNQK